MQKMKEMRQMPHGIAEDKSFLSLVNQSGWSVFSFSMDQDTLEADAIENIPTNVEGFIETCMEVD